MGFLFLFLVCIQCLFALTIQINPLSDLCGLKFVDRIVGGSESVKNAWPWTVSINLNFKHLCGGTLLNNQWVLSAAHCFQEVSSVSAYKVILGAHNVTDLGFGTDSIRMPVSKIINHELYTGRLAFDIALIKLMKPVVFGMNILPACMPLETDNFEDMECYFNGWGHTYFNGTLQNSLREIKLKIMNQTECSKYAFPNPEQKYCSGESNLLQDTCQGDSGGGMYCLMSDLKWYVGGIVSYGIGSCGNIGFNTRVDYFRRWIEKIIEKN